MKNLYCGKDTQLSEAVIKKKLRKRNPVSYYAEKPKSAKLKALTCLKAYRNSFMRE